MSGHEKKELLFVLGRCETELLRRLRRFVHDGGVPIEVPIETPESGQFNQFGVAIHAAQVDGPG